MKKTMDGTPLNMINIININESLNKYLRIMNRASLYNPIKIKSKSLGNVCKPSNKKMGY